MIYIYIYIPSTKNTELKYIWYNIQEHTGVGPREGEGEGVGGEDVGEGEGVEGEGVGGEGVGQP